MSYELAIYPDAEREWGKLDETGKKALPTKTPEIAVNQSAGCQGRSARAAGRVQDQITSPKLRPDKSSLPEYHQ